MAEIDNFDDLLDFGDTADKAEPAKEAAPKAAPKTAPKAAPKAAPTAEEAEEARIAELQAAVSAPMPTFEEPELEEPKAPAAELTENQRRIKELEDELARRNAKIAEQAPAQYAANTEEGERILIHVVKDGFTALGETWYRGQELEFVVGTIGYEQTKDRNGNTWVSLAGDQNAQIRRWGDHYLGVGEFVPRRGEKFNDSISAQDAARRRAVPIMR